MWTSLLSLFLIVTFIFIFSELPLKQVGVGYNLTICTTMKHVGRTHKGRASWISFRCRSHISSLSMHAQHPYACINTPTHFFCYFLYFIYVCIIVSRHYHECSHIPLRESICTHYMMKLLSLDAYVHPVRIRSKQSKQSHMTKIINIVTPNTFSQSYVATMTRPHRNTKMILYCEPRLPRTAKSPPPPLGYILYRTFPSSTIVILLCGIHPSARASSTHHHGTHMWRTWCRTFSQDIQFIVRSTEAAYSFYQHLPHHIPSLTCASHDKSSQKQQQAQAQAYLESIEDAAEQSYPHLCVLNLCMHNSSMHA